MFVQELGRITPLSSLLSDILSLPTIAPFAYPPPKIEHTVTVTRILSLSEPSIAYSYIITFIILRYLFNQGPVMA